MFDAISPSDPPRVVAPPAQAASGVARSGIPMDGVLGLGFRLRDGKTELGRLDQRAPCRAFLPYTARGEPIQVVLVNIAGGLVGGDRLSTDISAGAGTKTLVTTQAAEKIYRSGGREARIETRIDVAAGAWMEWMPQPTILFDGADLVRRTRLDLAPDARAMAGEILLLGRIAHGEKLTAGSLFDGWEVRRDGALVWLDRTLVEDWPAVLDNPAAFDGATAGALFLYAAPDAADWLDRARDWATADRVISGATVVNGLLIVRWIGREAARLTAAYSAFWARFRAAVGGWRPTLPTIWQC